MKLLHEKDTMTAEERLQAVIHLQEPDRVPVVPFIYYFAASYAGITNAELREMGKYNRALDKCFNELGPWDAYYWLNNYYPEMVSFMIPMKVKEPGIDLPPNSIRQFLEEEIMKEEEYDWIRRVSEATPRLTFFRLYLRWIPRIWDQVPTGLRGASYMFARAAANATLVFLEWQLWKRRGVPTLYNIGVEAPFDSFSLARGLLPFTRDLKKHPADILEAAEDLVDSYALLCKSACRLTGGKRAIIDVHRSSNDFISPQTFRELSFPSLKLLVEKLVAAGINPILHCDGNWDLNLETLRELPAGNVMVQFDGPTNIFLAKQVIGDRICIMGDVPPDMLVLGTASEVDEYCHRLIEEVGRGGGFVLGAGCEIPPNAKPKNVKAMLDSATKYGYYAP